MWLIKHNITIKRCSLMNVLYIVTRACFGNLSERFLKSPRPVNLANKLLLWVLHFSSRYSPICFWTLVWHCVKSVRIRSFSGLYFPVFGLNTERYSVSLRIQPEFWKIRTTKTPNIDIFHAVWVTGILLKYMGGWSSFVHIFENIASCNCFDRSGLRYFWCISPIFNFK